MTDSESYKERHSAAIATRERQSPDWRFARRHSGEWRSRETSPVDSFPNL